MSLVRSLLQVGAPPVFVLAVLLLRWTSNISHEEIYICAAVSFGISTVEQAFILLYQWLKQHFVKEIDFTEIFAGDGMVSHALRKVIACV